MQGCIKKKSYDKLKVDYSKEVGEIATYEGGGMSEPGGALLSRAHIAWDTGCYM